MSGGLGSVGHQQPPVMDTILVLVRRLGSSLLNMSAALTSRTGARSVAMTFPVRPTLHRRYRSCPIPSPAWPAPCDSACKTCCMNPWRTRVPPLTLDVGYDLIYECPRPTPMM